MNAAEFFDEASKLNIRLDIPAELSVSAHSLSNEALFQLPLLAMTILAITKGTAKPLLSEIGQLVGECLERTVPGFKGSSQDIHWSGNLRIRTIKALTFLEATGQIAVEEHTRRVSTTELGKKVYQSAIANETPLAMSMKIIELSYQYIRDEARVRGEVN
ncbi:hypothetical protein [Cupriavidus sp. IK-TO18]|uniref:hypothetical protein n=1 Tax=Cupriavidus sp. IK-TO18 TaxID=2782182 RepID=UPI00189AC1C1|nr:hypothetical protein [Cupriavidus sp. IK-TO18]MBF6986480.1 hypothetical protein [Cupriavidus sp. IK-TO18]